MPTSQVPDRSRRMMMTGYLVAASPQLRPQVIERWAAVASYAQEHEPETLRCAVLIPYEDDDGVSLYVIEEYANQEAEQRHRQAPPVKELLAFLFDETNPVLASKPVLHEDRVELSTGETLSFTRPTINDSPNAYIILATFHYQPGLTTAALPGWRKLVDYAQSQEPLTLTYTVLEDQENHKLRTVEAYESKEYARSVHIPAPVVKENQEQNGHMRVPGMPTTIYRGHKVAGYLGKV